VAVDNIQTQDAQDIEAQLSQKSIGDVIEFSVVRGSSTEEIDVELGAR
jgi:S1-C subfamily serine protease